MTKPEGGEQPKRGARKRSSGLSSLTGDAEFRQVRKGKTMRTPLFTLRAVHYRPKRGEAWRPQTVVGIVVSKKTLRLSVDRNRARRRVREALRSMWPELPPCRAIVLPSPAVLTADFETLRASLRRALDQAAP